MGDLVSLLEYIESKVNQLAQRYRKHIGTCMEHELKERLREAGFELARRKTFHMQKEKEENEE